MGQSIIIEALHQPFTTILSILLISIWALIHKNQAGYPEVGMSYDKIIVDKQYWRMALSQLSHVEVLHLIFNITALWSLGIIEQTTPSLGTLYFMKQTFFLFVLSPILCLALYHIAIVVLHKEEYRSVTAVGFSCVLFGWMSFIAVKQPEGISTSLPLFGAHIPLSITPFASVILTSLVFPRASFVGHIAGILSGYIIALVPLFDIIPPWLTMVMASFVMSAFFLNFLTEYRNYLQLDDNYLFNFFSTATFASAFNAPHLIHSLNNGGDIEQQG